MSSVAVVLAILATILAGVLVVRGFVMVRLGGFDAGPISDQVVGGGGVLSGAMIAGSSFAGIGQSNELWVFSFSLFAIALGCFQFVVLRLRPGRVERAGSDVIREIRWILFAEIFAGVAGIFAAAANLAA